MTQEHPITPPPELVRDWIADWSLGDSWAQVCQNVALVAARWGADQELEACCEWVKGHWLTDELRAARRPRPPSLKAGAIEVLDELDGLFELPAGHYNTILRALEQLDDSL